MVPSEAFRVACVVCIQGRYVSFIYYSPEEDKISFSPLCTIRIAESIWQYPLRFLLHVHYTHSYSFDIRSCLIEVPCYISSLEETIKSHTWTGRKCNWRLINFIWKCFYCFPLSIVENTTKKKNKKIHIFFFFLDCLSLWMFFPWHILVDINQRHFLKFWLFLRTYL